MTVKRDEFLGFWSSKVLDNISFTFEEIWNIHAGKNWIFAKTKTNPTQGCIHKKPEKDYQVIYFKGYIVDGPINTYSSSNQIYSYWKAGLKRKHNGVFSSVMVSSDGKYLQIVTDLFGISPLYYRVIGNMVAVASDPGLLYQQGDCPDYLAWYMRISIGYVPGKRSLIDNVFRVPNGSVVTFGKDDLSPSIEYWYDLDELSKPKEKVNKDTIRKFDTALEASFDRLARINLEKTILPLSGGDDSRLIFGKLLEKNKHFESYTVQVSDLEGNDSDAIYAKQIANEYSIPHHEISMPDSYQYGINDIKRINNVDCMTAFHTWAVPFFEALTEEKTIIYDGLAGDVLANGSKGWSCNGKGYSPIEKKRHIIAKLLPNKFQKILKPKLLFYRNQAIEELSEEYSKIDSGENQSEINYILWQSRKSTSLWAQAQAGTGKLVVYPYLDIDFIENAFLNGASEKSISLGQRNIIKATFPELLTYPSTSNPTGLTTNYIGDIEDRNHTYATQKLIRYCFSKKDARIHLKILLTRKGYWLIKLSGLSKCICTRTQWWSKQVCELVFYWGKLRESFKI